MKWSTDLDNREVMHESTALNFHTGLFQLITLKSSVLRLEITRKRGFDRSYLLLFAV